MTHLTDEAELRSHLINVDAELGNVTQIVKGKPYYSEASCIEALRRAQTPSSKPSVDAGLLEAAQTILAFIDRRPNPGSWSSTAWDMKWICQNFAAERDQSSAAEKSLEWRYIDTLELDGREVMMWSPKGGAFFAPATLPTEPLSLKDRAAIYKITDELPHVGWNPTHWAEKPSGPRTDGEAP